MTLRFYLVPFVTIFLKAINPGSRKSYVIKRSSVKLNQSKQALVFNSEPIGLAALLSPALSRDPGACSSAAAAWRGVRDLGRAHLPRAQVPGAQVLAKQARLSISHETQHRGRLCGLLYFMTNGT